MYIILFNLIEWLLLLLQNVSEVKQSTPALSAGSCVHDSTRPNGLVTQIIKTSSEVWTWRDTYREFSVITLYAIASLSAQ